jgi:hypothetical protein
MRTVRYLLITAAAALALTGCGGDEPPAAEPTASPEDAYLAQLEEHISPNTVRQDPDEWIDHGYEACEMLERGERDDYQVAQVFVSVVGLELLDAEALVWTARDHLCPDLP